jgi:HSP20 family protein
MTLLNVFKPSSVAGSAQPSANAEAKDVTYVRPRYEITEDERAFCVDVDLPGVGRKDVTPTLHDGILELTGERNWTAPKDWKPISGDHEAFTYRLKLMVGDRVAEGGISAETSNGVLRLTLPKEEEKKPRKIEIS